jgi:TolA-binding protein
MRVVLFLLLPFFLLSACSDSGARALLDKAIALEQQDRSAEALELLEKIMRDYADSDEAPEAMYNAAALYYNHQNDALKSATTYELLSDTYPRSPFGHKALFAAGFTYENDLGNMERARQAYEKYLREYPDSSMAETAQFSLQHLGLTPEQLLKMLQSDTTQAPVADFEVED